MEKDMAEDDSAQRRRSGSIEETLLIVRFKLVAERLATARGRERPHHEERHSKGFTCATMSVLSMHES